MYRFLMFLKKPVMNSFFSISDKNVYLCYILAFLYLQSHDKKEYTSL